jgi:hypothetical protein
MSRRPRAIAHAALATIAGTSVPAPLALTRSYAIPVDDPSYLRLLNWAWTYDSAVSSAAFSASGSASQAGQLLDQLTALQHTDGSIEFAFNLSTSSAQPLFRSGVIAWVGLAAAIYDKQFSSSRYLQTERRAADYLLTLQRSSGLVAGGPDVSWISTQHNLITYDLLDRLGLELLSAGNITDAYGYLAAAGRVAAGIDANLLVQSDSAAYFTEGVGDKIQPLDVQALGAMYLASRGQLSLAQRVLSYAQGAFGINARKIQLSQDPNTYNMTYSASRAFSGYLPYVGSNAPEVLWFEGTAQIRMTEAALGQSTSSLDEQITKWQAVTQSTGGAPLQADQTLTNAAYGVEYHVWPATVTTGWTLLAQSMTNLFPTGLK